MRILIINLHSGHNTGDAALTTVAIRQLRRHFPACHITLAMNDPESHAGDEPVVPSFGTWFRDMKAQKTHWAALPLLMLQSLLVVGFYRLTGRQRFLNLPPPKRNLLKAYLEADLVVSCAGGFLYSTKRGLGLLNSLFTLAYALWAGKPLYFLPQSYGPLDYGWQRWLLRAVFKGSRVIMVREPISFQYVRSLYRHPACYQIPDLAFALERATGQEQSLARHWLEQYGVTADRGRPWLGMTVIDWGGQEKRFRGQAAYENALAEAAEAFLERLDGTVIIFPQVYNAIKGQDDRLASRRVADRLRLRGKRVTLIHEPRLFPVVKAAYGLVDIFMGTRMHSVIFSMIEEVPVLAVGYQPKMMGLARLAELEKWVFDINRIDADLLIGSLYELWDQRRSVKNHLAQKVARLTEQADQAGLIIARDFRSRRFPEHR